MLASQLLAFTYHMQCLENSETCTSETSGQFWNSDTEQPPIDYTEAVSPALSCNHNVVDDDSENKAEESTAPLKFYSLLTTERSLLLLNCYVCHHNTTS